MTTIVPNFAVTRVVQSPNFSPGRPYGAPAFIVIHHWGVDGQTHAGVVAYLTRSGGNSSAHYVASAGRVTQLVSDMDRAWHAGASGNPRGIGIECRPEMSDADFHTVARLIAAIRSEHGHLPLVGHKDHMNTACPGRWYPLLKKLSDLADSISAGKASLSPDTRAQPVKKPTQPTNPPVKGKTPMLMIHQKAQGKTPARYAVLAPGFWLEFIGQSTANGFARQIGAPSVEVTSAFWNHCKKAADAQKADQQ